MPSLFSPLKVGQIDIKNRIIMAPMTRNRSPKAIPPKMAEIYYTQRASAGMIISEGIAFIEEAQGYSNVPGLYSDDQIKAWRHITDAVHQAGGKMIAQLWHTGRISHTSLQPNHADPVAPSAIQADARVFIIDSHGNGGMVATSKPRALTIDDLTRLKEDYCHAAAKAINEAGFDGVEVHAANGYLLDEFFHASSNKRNDQYGGSIENLVRFPLEVVAAVAKTIGGQLTGVKFSPSSSVNDIHDPDPQPIFNAFVAALAPLNLAYIHVVEGLPGGDRSFHEGENAFSYLELKHHYLNAGGRAAWLVNNGYTGEMAEKAVNSGYADMVSFARPYIANPDLVRRLKEHKKLNEVDIATIYGGGEKGYIDYPIL